MITNIEEFNTACEEFKQSIIRARKKRIPVWSVYALVDIEDERGCKGTYFKYLDNYFITSEEQLEKVKNEIITDNEDNIPILITEEYMAANHERYTWDNVRIKKIKNGITGMLFDGINNYWIPVTIVQSIGIEHSCAMAKAINTKQPYDWKNETGKYGIFIEF